MKGFYEFLLVGAFCITLFAAVIQASVYQEKRDLITQLSGEEKSLYEENRKLVAEIEQLDPATGWKERFGN